MVTTMKASKSIHVDIDLLKKAEDEAKETNASLNYVIEKALRQYFSKNDEEVSE